MVDLSDLLKEMTPLEKASLVSGHNFMYTNEIKRLGIRSIRCSDGPHGLRVQKEGGDNGVSGSEKATAFPTAATSACSWNPSLLYKMGEALGKEANYYNIDVILGPGCNIKRNPLAGRNFEYFSEDPLLAGKLAASEVQGIQSQGVSACIKHFALNNAENYRFMGDSVADMRAIREIYLKPFETVVKEGQVDTIMCSYNKINGTYASENKWLLKDVLREEWGFKGLTMTDWGATHNRLKMLEAGLDLEMPGDTAICKKWITDGIKNGALQEKDLDFAVKNVISLSQKREGKKSEDPHFKEHDALAKEIALESAVLLKNDGSLPLSHDKKYCVIGELFEKMRYQGAGSSMINPTNLTTVKAAFDEAKVSYVYQKGYRENSSKGDSELLKKALEESKPYEEVLLFLGLTDYAESEGADRENMKLPENQIELVNALIKEGKKIILVLFGGSPVELPFANKVSSILDMYLPGQKGGEATYELLFGIHSPSGKLAETWPLSYQDVPYGESFSKNAIEVYKESVFVGYRYYVTQKVPVLFPFGYGLSYSKFEYSSFTVLEKESDIEIHVHVKNVGNYDASEIVEIYAKGAQTDVYKPEKELRAFQKVFLKKGEEKEVSLTIKKDELRYWNIKENRFVLEEGKYEFQVGASVVDIKDSKTLFIKGEMLPSPYSSKVTSLYKQSPNEVSNELFEEMSGLKIPSLPPKKPITLESRFSDLEETFMGNILFKAVLSVAKKDMKKALKMKEGPERDNKLKGALFLKRILESNSLITMSMSASQSFPYSFAKGFCDLANGHLIRGITDFCKPIKIKDK